ncbi:MAG: EI24 domain-containing protein [Bacteroidia bacterium]|jgi:CysZ protein|nr:EI24 domain-containing protein [Bacteroidia bacterium]
MGFFKDLGLGFSSHIRAIEFIAKHNLWLYFLWPLLITIGLYVVGFTSTFYFGDMLANKVIGWISLDGEWDGWLDYLRAALKFLVSGILKIFMLILFSSMLKYIVLIICSPILALLSERIDEIITGTSIPFHFGQFLHDMLRGILITLRNMMMELLIWLACVVFCLIPFIGWLLGWLTIPFRAVVAWYFLGFSMMDYSYERRRMKISEGVRFTRRHKGIAIANGFVFTVLLWIPFLGISIAPVLSCVAATLAVLEASKQDQQQGYAQTLRTV